MKGTAPPSRCQSRVNPTSDLGTPLCSRLWGYWEHPKQCKAHSSTQERLPPENNDGHEEPGSRKAFQAMALVKEAASMAAQALHRRSEATHTSMCSPRTWALTSKHRLNLGASGSSLQVLLSLIFSGIFWAARRAHGRAEAQPLFLVTSWRILFFSMCSIGCIGKIICLAWASVVGCSRQMVQYPSDCHLPALLLSQQTTRYIKVTNSVDCFVQIQFRSFSLAQRHEMVNGRFQNC